ncbi:MAG: DUF429 domain-containing protein [Thermoplasmata archaeon]
MYVGLDLSGREENGTGVCILDSTLEFYTVFEDTEIIELALNSEIVAVDAPLTDTDKAFRPAEREMMEDFGPMLPLNTPGMKLLSKRGRRIKEELAEECEVIETYPRAVEKILDTKKTREHFENEDEFDAYLCALTAKKYSEGEYRRYGEEPESIILPLR